MDPNVGAAIDSDSSGSEEQPFVVEVVEWRLNMVPEDQRREGMRIFDRLLGLPHDEEEEEEREEERDGWWVPGRVPEPVEVGEVEVDDDGASNV